MNNVNNGLPHLEEKKSSFHHRLHSKKHIIKSFKAKADANRSLTERWADFITARLGSMTFLALNAVWFFLWISINTGVLPILSPFDPFPFGLLTMIVSLEAIFLANIVLISQNRAQKLDDIREEIALQIDTIAEEEITKIIELQVKILEKHGVDVSKDEQIQRMLRPIAPESIEQILEKQISYR